MNVHEWPWPDLSPSDFAAEAEAPTAPALPSRAMTAYDIAALGLGELTGGMQGHYVEGPDGKIYSVIVRRLLPDEKA